MTDRVIIFTCYSVIGLMIVAVLAGRWIDPLSTKLRHAGGRRAIWIASLAVSSVMLLLPPWSDVDTRISAAGYGPLFWGPLEGVDSYRLDIGRLFVQIAAVAAIAGVVDLSTRKRTPLEPPAVPSVASSVESREEESDFDGGDGDDDEEVPTLHDVISLLEHTPLSDESPDRIDAAEHRLCDFLEVLDAAKSRVALQTPPHDRSLSGTAMVSSKRAKMRLVDGKLVPVAEPSALKRTSADELAAARAAPGDVPAQCSNGPGASPATTHRGDFATNKPASPNYSGDIIDGLDDDEDEPTLHDAISLAGSIGAGGEDASSLERAIDRLVELTNVLDDARIVALKRETASVALQKAVADEVASTLVSLRTHKKPEAP